MAGNGETTLDDRVHFVGNVFCMPLTLVANFALFQYLLVTYYRRRKEWRVRLLLAIAFLGFAVIVPFPHPNRIVYMHLEDTSEVCSTLTFLVQIVIIGREVTRKIKIRALRVFTLVGELLSTLGFLLCAANIVQACDTSLNIPELRVAVRVVNGVSLAFIFTFRFLYIGVSKGVNEIWRKRRAEVVLYLLFVTYEYPFLLIERSTRASWLPVQALWNRVTLVLCVLYTIHHKIKSQRSRRGQSHSQAQDDGDTSFKWSAVRRGSSTITPRLPTYARHLSWMRKSSASIQQVAVTPVPRETQ
ncbi:hypothetical protein PINS_up007085 [Pythium insidiosum]|nr:hypothetical protein PINS_up007085 [Pythium insidiosum]